MMSRKLNPMRGRERLLLVVALLIGMRASAAAQDSFGYTASNAVAYSYVDISGTGTAVLANVDDGTATLTLPFGFKFYGTTYTSLCASSNGLVSFGGCPADDMTTRDLTAQPTPNNLPVIAPFWMDLTFAIPGAGALYYQTVGSPGTRQFVMQWSNVRALNGSDSLNFEVVLKEGTNTIWFQYNTVDSGDPGLNLGAGATVGIAAADALSNKFRLQWSRNVPVIKDSSAILFTPPTVAAAVDVSASVQSSTSAFVLNRATQTYNGSITITNTSSSGLARPLTIVLTGLSPGVMAIGATGALPGQGPYYLAPGTGNLAPGTSATVPVQFSNPTNVKIVFVVKTYSGSF
jgi:hypothetical protein